MYTLRMSNIGKLASLFVLALIVACAEPQPTGPADEGLAQGPAQMGKGGKPDGKGGGKPGGGSGYEIIDLGAATGHTSSRAGDLAETDNGEYVIVGSSWGPDDAFSRPTLWTVDSDGTISPPTLLSMPPGATSYAGVGAIVSGGSGTWIAVGTSDAGAAQWVQAESGSPSSSTLPDGASDGRANDVALVDGQAMVVGSRRTVHREAVYWLNGVVRSLPSEGAHASAEAVNSQGTIAGWIAPGHPVVWHEDGAGDYQVCDLGEGVDNSGIAYGISEPTGPVVYVVGASDARDWYATIWTVDLTDPDPSKCVVTSIRLEFFSEFLDVNANGDAAVGANLRKHKAILWTAAGALVDLPPLKKGTTSISANAINDDGSRIVGVSGGKAVLWKTP